MNVLVTGGTGFVGQEVVGELQAAAHSISLLVRDPGSAKTKAFISANKVNAFAGDVLDPKSIAHALPGIEAIIHLVGIISEVGENTFENIHVQGTQNLLAAAQRAGVRLFVHMSALGTRANAVSRYHKSKWAAEELVRQSELAHVIFRPSLIFGPRDAFVTLFARIIRLSPVVPLLARPTARFQPVAVEAVARAFVNALREPKAVDRTFDLCGQERFTFAEIIDEILTVMGKKRLKVRLPLPLARFQAALLEFVFPRLLHKAAPLNRDQLIMLQEDNVGDPHPANELFGLEQVGFREGIAKYLGERVETP